MNRIAGYLNKGGILVFDISTYYKPSSILGISTMADNNEQPSFIWFNYFDRAAEMNLPSSISRADVQEIR